MAKTLEELTRQSSSIWPQMQVEFGKSPVLVKILPADPQQAEKTLLQIQAPTSSDFGAILYHTGGLLIDHGWVRVLGSGSEQLRGIIQWNQDKTLDEEGKAAGSLLIADDVLGGLFAINGGGLGKDVGKIYYLAPDNFEWEQLNLGYADLIAFFLSGSLPAFYGRFRFDAWKETIKEIQPNQIWLFEPPMWTEEAEHTKPVRSILNIQEWFDNILNMRS
ncbi:DUF2625 family protein [Neisseria sp. Ec49-e6-T10]|uniref:DUF2625 family protein n=1 Tax=Neisseria sp. Ec49-e6-T10 TaxID=3140744 RepID=UPI003EBCF6CF